MNPSFENTKAKAGRGPKAFVDENSGDPRTLSSAFAGDAWVRADEQVFMQSAGPLRQGPRRRGSSE